MAKFRKNAQGNYSQKARETALKLYAEGGAAFAAKGTGINGGTIAKWASQAGVTIDQQKRTQAATEAAVAAAAEKRETIKLECRAQALEILRRMGIAHEYFVGKDGNRAKLDLPQAGDMKDYAIAFGVLVDKAELLDGRATSRDEHRNVDQMDREIEQLLTGADLGDRSPA